MLQCATPDDEIITVEISLTIYGHTQNQEAVSPKADCGDLDFKTCHQDFLHTNTFVYHVDVCQSLCGADACVETCLGGCLDDRYETEDGFGNPAICGDNPEVLPCTVGQDFMTVCEEEA